MFTGIISHLGKVKNIKGNEFSFSAPVSFSKNLKTGSSVAVNGVCLTVANQPGQNSFKVEVMPETLRRTTLGDLKKDDPVNLELPLAAKGRFEGHIVQGHVDGVGVVNSIKREENSHLFTFKIGKNLSRYVVEKGSIAVNGVSLTVTGVKGGFFSVGIIPYTWKNTTFGQLKVGDKVNIEVDILAKYLERIMNYEV